MIYTLFNITIRTRQRRDDWIAELVNNSFIWEAGQNECEAIGKLIITLTKGQSE